MSRDVNITLPKASTYHSEAIKWLWRDRIPMRGLTIVAGEKGLGKSLLTNALIPAALSRGELDGNLAGQPARSVVLSAEDDWRTVIKPRLALYDADLDLIHDVMVRSHDDGAPGFFTLPDHVHRLAEAMCETDDYDLDTPVKLLVVDPIGAFLGSRTDSHKDASVRGALAPLADLANAYDIAIVVVAHLNKSEGDRLITRVTGTNAFVNATRSVFGFVRDPNDAEGERGTDRVLVHVSSNWGTLAPSLALKTGGFSVSLDDGTTGITGGVEILGESDVRVEDVQRGGGSSDADTVESAILLELEERGGTAPSLEVKESVNGRLGCSTRTVQRHAMTLLNEAT